MKMRFLILVLAVIAFGSLQAQISRSEVETRTKKGISLMDNGKLEDAIAIFNDILSKDPTEGKALLLRARTKLELGAYKGAKKDCFAYMDIYGIDAPVAGLLGKTEKAMENYKQALAYLKAALVFDAEGEEYLLDRADIFYNLGLDDKACADWYIAKESGSSTAAKLYKSNCKSYQPPGKKKKIKNKKNKLPTRTDQEDYTSNNNGADDEEEDYTSNSGTENSTEEDDVVVEEENENSTEEPAESSEDEDIEFVDTDIEEDEVIEEIPEESYPIDDKVEEIYVDEDLTIVLADGIGSRKLIDMPDILILSDKSGVVVVNVCIDRLGRVQSPTLNEKYSTIQASSLISLALRESSNFRFARSSRKSHCGTITYKITGSE